jgi:hypothetical protein
LRESRFSKTVKFNCEVKVIVRQAKEAARQWVLEEGARIAGFQGAYLAGSITWLLDDAVLPASSDVDIFVVLADPPATKLGKFIYRDILLEVSYLPPDQLQSSEMILGHFQLAAGFRTLNIILDPAGQLTKLQAAVATEYAKRRWVYTRCTHVEAKVLGFFEALHEAQPFHDQVAAWLFGTSLTTHILLMAGLKHPTVRRRYRAAQELLADYDHLDFYERLLELLGCAHMNRTRVEQHLVALTEAFDVATVLIKTPYRFASDVSAAGRPIALDGSQELIEQGYPREAIFYMVATYSRCQHVLYHDAPPEIQAHLSIGYRQLLSDLGITSFADLRQRGAQVKAFLPRVWEVAEAIMVANPDITD